MEHVTIESIQRLTPEQQKELNDRLARRLVLHIAAFAAVKILVLIFIRRTAKKYWTAQGNS